MGELAGEWANRVEAIEAGYEYMLAYAAQGREKEPEGASSQIRDYLGKLSAALEGLAEEGGRVAEEKELKDYQDYLTAVDFDAARAKAGIQLVLAQTAISSQLVDNLNASIHLRALLTDMFLFDEVLK